jgi:hypothetical protein
MKLTAEQIDDIRHALKNGDRFYTGKDNKSWIDLVEKGYAIKGRAWIPEDMTFADEEADRIKYFKFKNGKRVECESHSW